MQQPIVLFLTSTSFHFPLDLHALLVNEGQESKRFDSIDDFLSTPDRHTPYLAVIEVGSTDDLDRAQLAYEWCEKVQPIAACRILLLFASKNISLGDRASRFGNAELVHLPMPMRNLLFKVDLQKRLLLSDQQKPKTKEEAPSGFSASLVDRPPKTERVLLARGPGPSSGQWRQADNSPQGKVRWRWVPTPHTEPAKEAEKTGVSWVAESKVAPVFEHNTESWLLDDPEAELLGFRKEKQIFSARKALKAELRAPGEKQNLGKATAAAPSATQQGFAGEKGAASADSKIESAAPASPAGKTTFAKETPVATSSATAPAAEAKAPSLKIAEKFEPDAAKPESTATKFYGPAATPSGTGSAPAPAPAWKQHPSAPETKVQPGARPPSSQSQTVKEETPGSAPAPAISITQEKPRAPEEDKIPEHISEDETGTSGYSTSVPTGGKEGTRPTKLGGLDDKIVSSPQEQIPRGGSEYTSAAPDTSGAADQPRPAQGAMRVAAEKFGQGAPASAREQKVPGTGNPGGPRQPKNLGPTEEEQESLRDPSKPRPKLERENLTSRLHAAKPETVHEPFASSASTKEATQEGPQGARTGRPITEETETKVKGDLRPEALSTKIAVEGEVSRTEEEIRIKATVQAERAATRAPKTPEMEDYLKLRHFVTMTLEELADRDSSWHPVEKYRIYLSAQHRYYGVKNPEALLPLWVYEGELAPEFLDEKQAWKFYDRYPELYTSLDTLPPEVLAQVNAVAGVVAKAGGTAEKVKVNWNSVAGTVQAAEVPLENQPTRSGGGVIGFFKRLFGLK